MNRNIFLLSPVVVLSIAVALPVFVIAAPPTPVASWLFDDGAGLIASAHTGVLDGTLTGGGGAHSTGPIFSSEVPLSYTGNYALDFDGTDDDVNMGSDTSLDLTDELTVAAWFNPRQVKTAYILSNAGTIQNKYFSLFIESDGRLSGFIFDDGVDVATAETALPVVVTNEWTHVAYTYDGLNGRLYVDGGLAATSADFVGPSSSAGTVDFEVGSRVDASYFDGLIDEVAVWNNALTQDDILLIRDRGLNAIPEPSAVCVLLIAFVGQITLRQRRTLSQL